MARRHVIHVLLLLMPSPRAYLILWGYVYVNTSHIGCSVFRLPLLAPHNPGQRGGA